jgi:hypothetical protein
LPFLFALFRASPSRSVLFPLLFKLRILSLYHKAIPVTDRGGPKCFETSRLLHFVENRLKVRWSCEPYTPAGRPLPPGRFLILISVRGWVDPRAIVRLEGLGKLKKTKTMTTLGIEPATLRLVA